MRGNRVLHCLLTIIAIELGVIAARDLATPASAAQATQQGPIPVVIEGVRIDGGWLPVQIAGTDHPIQIQALEPIKVEAARPIVVETADRPLLVQSVQAPPAARPGVTR